MSGLKKHFQNFSIPKQSNPEDTLPTAIHHQQRRSSHDTDRTSCSVKFNNHRHTTALDGPMKDASIDVLSFKSDIFNCLDMCTAYIQALNTLCSTGAVLAQNLTQVFSRDVNVDGDTIVSKSSNNQSRSSNGRRRFLGLKGPRGHNEVRQNASSVDDELESNYYEVAEHFLQVWETMSVSTAGASATIKTETLMTLQDVLNNLEQENLSSDLRSKGDLGNNLSLEKSIQAAKSCLLAYIELQAQFSYNSWKSLNHLSKVLKSDPSMADVICNVGKHFPPKNSVVTHPNGSAALEPKFSFDQQKKSKKVHDHGPGAFDGAINLLSMDNTGSKKGRKKYRKRQRHDDSEKKASLSSAKTVSSQFPVNQSQLEGVSTSHVTAGLDNRAIIIKQSTWPGKEAVASLKRNEFSRNITSDDWSMWPKSNNSDLQARSNDLFEGVKQESSYHLPWSHFSSPSSPPLNSAINDASVQLSALDPSVGLTSNNSQFEPFVHRDTKAGDRFTGGSLRTTFNGPLNNVLDAQTNLSVIELAKKLSLSSEGVYHAHSGYTFAADPFNAPSGNSPQLQSLDMSRSTKLSTWPMKQTNNNPMNGNNDWATFDSQLAFDSNTPSLFGTDSLSSNYQGSSTLWPFDNSLDQEKNLISKVPTASFNSMFLNETNNNGHKFG